MSARRTTAKAWFPSHPCSLRQLPRELHVEAARTAIQFNPANAVNVSGLANVPHPDFIALLTGKKWNPAGVKLPVKFLDSPDAATKRMILEHANEWGKYGNVEFLESVSNDGVRLARAASGYWSYLGTDILHVSGPTMNLQNFTSRTPLSEYMRVVQHEFGHTLGFPHEHQRKGIIQRLNPPAVISEFRRTQGWNEQEVYAQILTPYDESALMATPTDEESIMTYWFAGTLTLDHKPIVGGSKVNANDGKFCGQQYPKANEPPPSGRWTVEGSFAVACGNCGQKAVLTPTIKAA